MILPEPHVSPSDASRRFWRLLGTAVLCAYAFALSSKSATLSGAPPELVLQTGHGSRVNCAVFAPDHRWLASGGVDNTIRIWDVSSGLELRALHGHNNWIKSLAVSHSGELLASAANDQTIKVWNVVSGREVVTLINPQNTAAAILFSADDKWIIAAGADNVIRVWDIGTANQITTLKDHTGEIICLAMSSDGAILASASSDNTVRIWDLKTSKDLRTINQTTKVTALAFSPNGRLLLTGDDHGGVALWEGGKAHSVTKASSAKVLNAQLSNDAEFLTISADGTVAGWDLQTGKKRRVLPSISDGELLFGTFSGDGSLIASGNGDRQVQIRNAADGNVTRALVSRSAGFFSVACSADGKWIAAGTNAGDIRIWQVATGQEMPRLTGHTGWVNTIAFSPDGTLVASGSNSGELKLWDVSTSRNVHSELHRQEIIHAVAFSPDGKWLASAGTGQTVHLLEIAAKRSLDLSGHTKEITSLVFIPNSSLIASGSTDKTIRIWDLKTGNTAKTINSLSADVNALAVSFDGRILAAGTADNKIELMRLSNGEDGAPQVLSGHAGEIFALAFSRDGKWLASGGADHTVRLWDTQAGAVRHILQATSGEINELEFSSDSRSVISAGGDGSMIIWDTASWKLAAIISANPGSDDWLVVTPGGLFDGSPPAWNQILWRFNNNTFDHAPVEAFFNEYYYPGLLADILAGRQPQPPSDISQKDRRAIPVTIRANASPDSFKPVTSPVLRIQVEVVEAPSGPDIQDKNRQLPASGARDLRLFRNGSLVKLWSGDLLGLNETDGCKPKPQIAPLQSRRTICTATVPIVAGANNFTAYAFNNDNIKSEDAKLTVTGSESLKRAGTLYLVAVGVNDYENRAFDLTYAVPDAEDFAAELQKQQEKLKRYERTKIISLYNEQAKKEKILLALTELAGKVKPEDAVVVYFAGHGTIGSCLSGAAQQVNAKDRFYLVPYDLGYQGVMPDRCEQNLLDEVARHSVSDLELETSFEKIDAGQLLLVIDACNSGQALESEEKRRGPMNSKGLAQLAYEKGMYVLTAALSFQEAKADRKVAKGHGYLTYALIEEALKQRQAADKDGNVLLREWVDFAVQRVPRMQQVEAAERRQFVKKQAEATTKDEEVQPPRVFYRREPDLNPFIVARP